MTEQVEKARGFLALHHGQQPLLLPNPWDRGSAVLLASLGFNALATTSSGFAATLGRIYTFEGIAYYVPTSSAADIVIDT